MLHYIEYTTTSISNQVTYDTWKNVTYDASSTFYVRMKFIMLNHFEKKKKMVKQK